MKTKLYKNTAKNGCGKCGIKQQSGKSEIEPDEEKSTCCGEYFFIGINLSEYSSYSEETVSARPRRSRSTGP